MRKSIFMVLLLIIFLMMIGCAGMSMTKNLTPVDKTFTINIDKDIVYENVLIWLATNFDDYEIEYQNPDSGKIIVRNLRSQVPSGIFQKLYHCSMSINIQDNKIHIVFNDIGGFDDTHNFHQKLANELHNYLSNTKE